MRESDESGLHAAAVELLASWPALDRDQLSLSQSYLSFLAACPDATWRSCEPGHLTASAIVFSADLAQVLLTLHPRVGRWLQLGGHCETGDQTLPAAALREAFEESGISGLTIDPVPVRLDVHPITCSLGRPTRHLDVQFRAVAPPGATASISSESVDLAWWPVDELPVNTDESVRLLVAAARRAAPNPGAAQ